MTGSTHTLANQDRDFAEWHGGIARYGFWAVTVDCPQWQALFAEAARHLSDYVLPGYARQPHITIAAGGLLDEAHLSAALRRRQTEAVRGARQAAFDLQVGQVDSFTGSPHVAVRDPAGALSRLRSRLQAIARHDPPATYRPHMTVGLYRDAFCMAGIHRHLMTLRMPSVPALRVREISFCAYATHELQGRFEILETIQLEGT